MSKTFHARVGHLKSLIALFFSFFKEFSDTLQYIAS